jgi:4-amino-4-deoxy-L-arabinose transferase-like glycosyltransferase
LASPTLRLVEFAGVLVAFYVAYGGVQMLEHREDTPRSVVRFVLATIILTIVTWRVRDRAGSIGNAPPPLPALDRDALHAPWPFVRMLFASWQSLFFWGILVAAVGLAIALRLHLITNSPYGIWFDEAQNGIAARRILNGERPIYISEKTQLPALFFYVFAASLRIIGESVTALRTVTAVAGVLTVGFVYLLGRELFDHRVGVLSAFFLAVMRWHLNFSRFGMHGIFAPLFMVATFYFLVRGLKGKGAWNFVAAGVMAGVGLQGYYSFNLVPFVVGLYVLHHLLFERALPWRPLALGLGAFALATLIVYAPLGIWAIRHQDEFLQRSQTVSITKNRSASEVLDVAYTSTKKHLLMFNQQGDRNGRHNIPGAPMLDAYTGFLFILGAGYALTRVKRSACFLLLAWLAISLLSGILSVDFEAPQAYRTVAITPAIAMLAALPLTLLWRIVTPPEGATPEVMPVRRWGPRIITFSTVGAAAALTVFILVRVGETNYDEYFNVQLKRSDSWGAYTPDATFVAKEIERLGDDHDYRVTAVLQNSPEMTFLNPDLDPARAQSLDWSVQIPSATGNSTVYLLDGLKKPFYDWIRQVYPDGEFRTLAPPRGDGGAAYEAVIPAVAVRRLQGIDGVYTATSAAGATIRRRESSMNLNWSSESPVSLPADATWSGALRADEYRDYSMRLDLPGSARIFIDDELVSEGAERLVFAKVLYKGDHELRIEARVERHGTIVLSSDGAPLPPRAFLSYPQSRHGLIATFYGGEQWDGQPVLVELDPFVGFRYHSELDAFPRPFTATWTGFLDIPFTGPYSFQLDAKETGTLMIDGTTIDAPPGNANRIVLEEGRHAIEVRLSNRPGGAAAFLYWMLPFETERSIIPNDRFAPR